MMNHVMVKGTLQEKNDLIRLTLEFLEARNPDLKIGQSSWNLIRGKDYEGNLSEIQQLFMTPTIGTLKTENPQTLLHQLTEISQGDQIEII